MMIRRFLALAALLAASATARADMLVPYDAESIDLGKLHGWAYYSKQSDGFRVVATLADGEAALLVRFEGTLADHQKLAISVPGKVGEAPQLVEFSRTGDRIFVDYTPRVGLL